MAKLTKEQKQARFFSQRYGRWAIENMTTGGEEEMTAYFVRAAAYFCFLAHPELRGDDK